MCICLPVQEAFCFTSLILIAAEEENAILQHALSINAIPMEMYSSKYVRTSQDTTLI